MKKILLLALGRCGSKFIQTNLNFYLKTKYGKSLDHPKYKWVGFGELLNVRVEPDQFHLELLKSTNNKLIFSPSKYHHHDELESRLKIIQCDIPVVAKYMPIHNTRVEEISIVNKLISMFDRIYIIRRNIQDHVMSLHISNQLKSWGKGKEQEKLIQKHLTEKIKLDDRTFHHYVNLIHEYYSIIDECKTPQCREIKFEDIILLKNREQFCNLFDIDNIDFHYFDDFEEYGQNKYKIIDNYGSVT